MEKFDIFIKGVNPERDDDISEIKANAAKVLQISLDDLENLLAQSAACIRRGAEEEEAKQYQRTLSSVGLICIYSPSRKNTKLELVPMAEEGKTISITHCPNCESELSINEDGSEPEKCEQCGISIAKFLEQRLQAEEREAIKAKLLAAQTTTQQENAKRIQESIEKQRKLDLEKQVLEELQGGKIKKPLNLKLLIVGGGLLITTAGASYFLTSTTKSTDSASSKIEVEMKSPVAQQAATNTKSKSAVPVSSQEAMQKTHDQAAQVLKGFGLNADAFSENGSAGEAALPTEDMLSGTTPTTNKIATVTKSSNSPVDNAVSSHEKSTPMTTSELFSVLNNTIAWDYFLAQNSKILLERQLPENAAKLNKLISANVVYIDAMGELLRASQQAKQTKLTESYLSAIENRLMTLPAEQQAIYFAQASRYLPLENGMNRLLTQAETLLASLPKPEFQLTVVLKLAVIHSKNGSIANANNYFNKINTLLTPITDLDMQVQLRTEVAKAYQEINNTSVAKQWLNSTEPLVKQIKSETLNGLILSYAACNQWQSALNLLPQVDANYDTRLYQTIGASLKAGFISDALELNKHFHSKSYNALANVLIATYSSTNANSLLANSELLLNEFSPFERAIVASQLVDYYGKSKNVAKTETFLKISQEALASFPNSDEKDVLLEAVMKHYAQGFQIKAANNLLILIQSTALKTRSNIEVNQLSDVAGLLK